MRAGLENKRNVAILVVLGIVLIAAIVYFVRSVFVGGSTPAAPAAPAASVQPGPGGSGGGSHTAQKLPSLAKLDPTLHPEVMAGAESLEYNGSGRNIFSMTSAPVKIEEAKGPVRPQSQPEIAKGPPPPPPIDLKFFGYEAGEGARKAFLLHNDDVFIASEGDVVDHHYKIIKINPLSIQVTDLLYNNTQTLPLSQS
jgi:hypothetical protein